jgi:uncharacterized membrane protein YgaE (UPF0421/DUF939 family)
MKIFPTILSVIGILIGFVLILYFLTAGSIFHKQLFGVWNANVDRQIFQESQSYVEGKEQEQRKLEREKRRQPDRNNIEAIENLQNQLAPINY